MKRELAFALDVRSQFTCFVGRTRSSKTPPVQFTIAKTKSKERSIDRSENSVDEVRVNRRSKRVKTGIPAGDLVNVAETKGDEESAAIDEVKGDEEPAAAAEDVAKGEEEGKGLVDSMHMKSKRRKNQVNSSVPKRFTRSALKEKEENVEELGTPTRKKLELKMSKKIGLNRTPTNMRELLETGLLEGFRVFYNFDDKGRNLQGVIKGVGIQCSCSLCEGSKVISPSQFELHACKSYRHAIKYICLENRKSLLELMEVCKASALESLEVALQNVISSLPVKGSSVCTNCNGSFEPSSSANLSLCESCVSPEQVQAGQRVATRAEVRASSSIQKTVTSSRLATSPHGKSKRGRKRKSKALASPTSSTKPDLLHEKSEPEMGIKSRKKAMRSSKTAANRKPLRNKTKVKIVKRSLRSASASTPTESATKCTSSQQKSGTKLTIKNQQLHWAVFDKGGLPDGTELTYVSHGQKLLDGYKLGHGIFCFCCNAEISASQFEAHAGWASRKKPYENIYISNGVSLHEYAMSLKKNSKCSVKQNDDLCRICGDGGNLLLCDGCPRSFHQECASEPSIPHGKWYCKYCQQSLKFVGESANAVVAGRVTGIDSIEQITKRCIRIAKNPENNDLVACVLCRCHDFSKRVFNDRTVIVCDQCEREYHIGCLREHDMANLKALPKGNWFCCSDCERIHSVLKNLLAREPEKLPDALMAVVREKQKGSGLDVDTNFDMRFRLLCGKNVCPKTRSALAQAVDIFHECFDPIIDATSGRDFIPSMVYGRKIWGQDFAGMLCAILTIDKKVVTAGSLRVFGQEIAELPIAATSKCNQGKGYFQLLFTCIERLLSSLNIKKIVLPAAEEAKSIWTNKFGFETVSPQQLNELRQTCSALMTFKGTFMLQKEIPRPRNGVADAGTDIFNSLVE